MNLNVLSSVNETNKLNKLKWKNIGGLNNVT